MMSIIDFEVDYQVDSYVDHDVFSEVKKRKESAKPKESTTHGEVPVVTPQIIEI